MVKEMRRINEELERIREPAAEAVARERLPTCGETRTPASGA
jgi:hypothetical protein